MDLTTQLQQHFSSTAYAPDVLLVKPTTCSTNDDVRELAKQGLSSVLVCSQQQTAGRGQRLRPWISPQGNIYLSTLLCLKTAIDGRLALEVALNILQIPALKDLPLQVKWPNDLYSQHGKWGGILIEPISSQQVIVGVGINLNPVQHPDIEQASTDLTTLGLSHPDWATLVSQLYVAIQTAGEWFNYGSVNLAARFNHRAAFYQQTVRFEHLQGHNIATFAGIQDDGAIVLNQQQLSHTFYQGRLFPL